MSSWNFSSDEKKYSLLAGMSTSDNFPAQVSRLIEKKELLARKIIEELLAQPFGGVGAEIGVGCGFMSKIFAKWARHLYCCDISSSFLEAAKQHCSDIQNIDFVQLEREEWRFVEEGSLDFVIANNVLLHCPLYEVYWILRQTKRLLKPGGKVLFDFMSSDKIDFVTPGEFHRMFELYHKNPEDITTLLHFNSEDSILRLCDQLGFKRETWWQGESEVVLTVFRLSEIVP